jgi:hypothetical protein
MVRSLDSVFYVSRFWVGLFDSRDHCPIQYWLLQPRRAIVIVSVSYAR